MMIDYGEFIRAKITHSQSADTAEGYPCELTNSLGRQLLDYKIYGNSTQDGFPSSTNPVAIVSVGDLVTDKADENYGKYKIPVTVSENGVEDITRYIYLDEPLRKIGDYQDYIDFKNKKVVRQIKKYSISPKASWVDWQTGNGSRIVFYISTKLYGNNLTTLGYFNYDKVFQNLYKRPANSTGLFAYIDGSNTYWYPDYTIMGLDGSEDLATANEALQNWLKSTGELYFTYVLKNPVETKISLPVIPTLKRNCFIEADTALPPSNIYAKYITKP